MRRAEPVCARLREQGMATTVLASAQTRLALLANEIQVQKHQALQQLMLALAVVFCLGLGVVLALSGAAQVVGALSGGHDVLQPLRHLTQRGVASAAAGSTAAAEGLKFQRVKSVAELDAIVAEVPLDMLQLHGHETPARVAEVKARYGLPVMKVIGVADEGDLGGLMDHSLAADQIMIDAADDVFDAPVNFLRRG